MKIQGEEKQTDRQEEMLGGGVGWGGGWGVGEETVRKERGMQRVVVGWLLNVPATCQCISGTDLLRQFYVLPH